MEKAYDTTWKYGIMRDLNDLGLKCRLPNLIDNFLSYIIFVEIYVPGRTNLRSTKSNLLILKRTESDTKTTCKKYGWLDFRVFAPFYGIIYLFYKTN